MPTNFDIKSQRKDLYAPKRGVFGIVDVPPLNFVMVDGAGDPNVSPDYAAAIEALYTVSYGARGIAKKELDRVHTVGPLEGLWDADDKSTFTTRDKGAWKWTMMIVQPEWITAEIVERAIRGAVEKGVKAAYLVRFAPYVEGRSVQTLHVGSFDDEGPTLARMHDEYIPENGLVMTGRHHEIYLSDARRVEPAKLRTILRQPVADA
ncbi:GyrI-like domain-containing protein [Gordonia sp. CPCC 205333]|uniref:GyrI-like domain-containing protein n=1 Tax=Gordonia sp. CPCC 205333 TaxID=3140790 RepID=UPI003AF38764